jgi:hypothetical protein
MIVIGFCYLSDEPAGLESNCGLKHITFILGEMHGEPAKGFRAAEGRPQEAAHAQQNSASEGLTGCLV